MRRLAFAALAAVSILWIQGCGEELGAPDPSQTGFQRVVLAELYTATWCGNCPKAEAGLDRLHEEEGPAKIAVIHWHPTELGDPFGLPIVDERWGAYKARFDTLGVPAFPSCVFDGIDMLIGAETNPYPEYAEIYEHERAVPAPVALSMTPEITAGQLELAIAIEAGADAAAENLDLWVVVVEHRIARPDIPSSTELFSFVARAAASQTVQLQAGAQQEKEATFTLDPAWDPEKLHVVAFLQEKNVGEVRQAAMLPLSYRAFTLAAADTVFIEEEAPRSFSMPFTIANTGTARDSLEIDLPAAGLDLPAGWAATLMGSVPLAAPLTVALGPGETIDSLRVHVTTSSATGKGAARVAVRSLIEAGSADDLTFHFQFGGISFTAVGPAGPLTVQPGQVAFGQLELQNTGIEEISMVVTLPASQPDLPAGWSAALTSATGTPLTSPYSVAVAAGDSFDDIGVRVTTGAAGFGKARVLVSSPESISDPIELEIEVQAGDLAFTVAPQDTTVVVPIGSTGQIRYRLALTGTISSPIHVDATQTGMPPEWVPVLCDDAACYGPSYTVPANKLAGGIMLDFIPSGAGSGSAPIYFSSTVDPTVIDTAWVHYSTSAAPAADRMVLTELFTSIYCPNCPEAEAALDQLQEEEAGNANLARIHWHTLASPIPDPFYGTAHADSLFSILRTHNPGQQIALPTCVFDGDNGIGGGSEQTYAAYRARFDAAIATPSPLALDLTLDATTARIVVTTEVAMDEGASLLGAELKVVLVEDDAYKSPAPHGGQRYVARTYWRRIITLGAGATEAFTSSEIAIDPTWSLTKLYVVVMVREPDFGIVHQSAMEAVPFGRP